MAVEFRFFEGSVFSSARDLKAQMRPESYGGQVRQIDERQQDKGLSQRLSNPNFVRPEIPSSIQNRAQFALSREERDF